MSDRGGTRRGGHDGGTGAILAAFIANVGVGLSKLAGFLLTGSSALGGLFSLYEGYHEVEDPQAISSRPGWRSGSCSAR